MPALQRKKDLHRLRTGAGPAPGRAKKGLPCARHGNPGAHGDRPAVARKKEAVSGSCSDQDDSASGFAWVAREPQLMCGAEGRASSQRSIDYHSPPRFCQGKNPGSAKALAVCRAAGPDGLPFTRSVSCPLDAPEAGWTQDSGGWAGVRRKRERVGARGFPGPRAQSWRARHGSRYSGSGRFKVRGVHADEDDEAQKTRKRTVDHHPSGDCKKTEPEAGG